jgi:methylated-DNA-[protein]-cysteine S-methyltransferase
MTELRYAVFETKMGWVGILASDTGLVRTTLPSSTPAEATAGLGPAAGKAANDVRRLLEPIRRLSDYFDGQRVEFPDKPVYERSTPFQQRVWEATRRIPYGETRTYGQIAREAGSPGAARAVGQALGENPLPILVPCHRVIGSDGGLTGFGGGLEMKQRLLELEAIAAAVSH